MDLMMVFPYPMDLMMVLILCMMVFPYLYGFHNDLDSSLTLWILWPMDPMMVFPYPMDPYDGPIPYQWPALLSLNLK